MKITKRIGAVFIASFLLVSCASGSLTTREKGAGIGAVGGATVGGILSQSWWGALLGAVLGGVGGGVLGDQMQDRERLEKENECLRNLRPGADPNLCKQR